MLMPPLHTHTILTSLRRPLKSAPQQVIDWSMTRSSSRLTTEERYGNAIGAMDLVRSCPRAYCEADRSLLLCAARAV